MAWTACQTSGAPPQVARIGAPVRASRRSRSALSVTKLPAISSAAQVSGWPIDEDEMRQLMQEIVNRLYTFHLEANDPKLAGDY